MYIVIGADGREYGPATTEDIGRWITEGRCNAQTRVRRADSVEWRPLVEYPELAAFLAGTEAHPISSPDKLPPGTLPLVPHVDSRQVELSPSECIGRAWRTVTSAGAGIIFGAVVLWLFILIGLGILSRIPLAGLLVIPASWVIQGPLIGGLCYLILRVLRGQEAELADLFAGFRYRFVQLFLGWLVTGVLLALTSVPGGLVSGMGAISIVLAETAEWLKAIGATLIALGFLLMLIPVTYLAVCWWFVLPLIMEKGLDFWPAMKLSRRVVHRHWGRVFLLALLILGINVLGALACCIGLLFTLPLSFTAAMHAYEQLFTWYGHTGPVQPTPASIG